MPMPINIKGQFIALCIKNPKNMHKIDYEKLISIKRDVGWFEKKREILSEGWPRLYTGVQKKRLKGG